MPHHKSAAKRMKTNKKRNLRNRYERKTLRTLVKNVRQAQNAEEANQALEKAIPQIDRAARKGYIHKNKAARDKSRLIEHVRSFSK